MATTADGGGAGAGCFGFDRQYQIPVPSVIQKPRPNAAKKIGPALSRFVEAAAIIARNITPVTMADILKTLADRAGYHRNLVSLIERGEANPSLTTLFDMAATLGIPPSKIVTAVERLVDRRARKNSKA